MKTKAVSFRISEEHYNLAQEIGKHNEVSMGTILRDCIKYELDAIRLWGYGSFIGEARMPQPKKLKKTAPYIKEPIPEALRWEVFERDHFKCKKCGHRRFLQADHIVSEAKGGKTTLDNLQTLCGPCNRKKGSK